MHGTQACLQRLCPTLVMHADTRQRSLGSALQTACTICVTRCAQAHGQRGEARLSDILLIHALNSTTHAHAPATPTDRHRNHVRQGRSVRQRRVAARPCAAPCNEALPVHFSTLHAPLASIGEAAGDTWLHMVLHGALHACRSLSARKILRRGHPLCVCTPHVMT
jgi:hypothetical protein